MSQSQDEREKVELFSRLVYEFARNSWSAEAKRLKKQIERMGATITESAGHLHMSI